MTNNGTIRKNLDKGMLVEINPQSDRSRKLLIQGKISKILTNSEQHSHGILVELETGETGRVKQILDGNISTNDITDNSAHLTPIETKTLKILIDEGENHHIEFKSSILWSARLANEDIQNSNSIEIRQYGKNASKVIIAKTIAGFLNSDGGTLMVGVKENKNSTKDEIIGVESEFSKLSDQCKDGYRRMILDSIIKPYFPSFIFNHINSYLNILFEDIDGNLVCGIQTNKSDRKVFLKLNKVDCFLIRVDASTRFLQGEEVVDYCMKRFISQ